MRTWEWRERDAASDTCRIERAIPPGSSNTHAAKGGGLIGRRCACKPALGQAEPGAVRVLVCVRSAAVKPHALCSLRAPSARA